MDCGMFGAAVEPISFGPLYGLNLTSIPGRDGRSESGPKGAQMRKLSVNTFVTLDGVMQAPGGPEEDPSGGFEFGGWSFHYWDDLMQEAMGEVMGKPFDLLLGRKTYEIFAAFWPHQNDPAADALNNATKYVASTT